MCIPFTLLFNFFVEENETSSCNLPALLFPILNRESQSIRPVAYLSLALPKDFKDYFTPPTSFFLLSLLLLLRKKSTTPHSLNFPIPPRNFGWLTSTTAISSGKKSPKPYLQHPPEHPNRLSFASFDATSPTIQQHTDDLFVS